jgi:2'-hydroxyisoflavone reductase
VTGEPIPFGRLLGQCVAGTDSGAAVLQWVPSARLLAAGVDPWMGVPLWIGVPGGPEPGREGLSREREKDLLR